MPKTDLEPTTAETAEESRQVAHPATGELVDLNAPTDALGLAIEALGDLRSDLREFELAIERELVARLDRAGERKIGLELHDGRTLKLETNAPTERAPVAIAELRAAVDPLVAAGELDRVVLTKLIVRPPAPPAPPARVDARTFDKLLKSGNEQVRQALEPFAKRVDVPRKLKVKVER